MNKRKKVLAEFREKLLSPQPPRKKIRFNLHMKPIFQTGDLIAIQLKTLDKHYPAHSKLGEDVFRGYDGKYIVLRKAGDEINQYSSIEPQLTDYWVKFQLYNVIFDECPTAEQLENISFVPTRDNSTFTSESSLFHLKKEITELSETIKIIFRNSTKPTVYRSYSGASLPNGEILNSIY